MKPEFSASCFGFTHRGRRRAENQDNLYFNASCPETRELQPPRGFSLAEAEDPFMFAVFDGMGGETNGALAAYTVADALDSFRTAIFDNFDAGIKAYAAEAERRIRESPHKSLARGGSTLALICLSASAVYCANIGDSRVYRFRGGELIQLSEDHNQAGLLKKMGIPNLNNVKGRLTLYFGAPEDELTLEPYYIRTDDIRDGDRYLVCSDGLTDMVSDNEITAILKANADEYAACDGLLGRALDNGGADNITAILIRMMTKANGA
jgi:protein phosphatase